MNPGAYVLREYYNKRFGQSQNLGSVGVELEFPIITQNQSFNPDNVKKCVTGLLHYLVNNHGFQVDRVDSNGFLISVINHEKKACISLEYCYALIEFSLGPFDDVHRANHTWLYYFKIVRAYLVERGFNLLDKGFNDNYSSISSLYLDTPYHDMIRSEIKKSPFFFDGLLDLCGKFASAQTHIDIKMDRLLDMVNLFSSGLWVNGILFANSPNKSTIFNDNFYCVRDAIWKALGLTRNSEDLIQIFSTEDAYYKYLACKNIFFVVRDTEYVYFDAMPFNDYIQEKKLIGKKYVSQKREYVTVEFEPIQEDAEYVRILDYVRPTHFGTIEVRGDCQQPFNDTFAPVAFNLGMSVSNKECFKLVNDFIKDSAKLRDMAVRKAFNGSYPVGCLQDFLLEFVTIIQKGLKQRGFGEEQFIDCLYDRIKNKYNPASNA